MKEIDDITIKSLIWSRWEDVKIDQNQAVSIWMLKRSLSIESSPMPTQLVKYELHLDSKDHHSVDKATKDFDQKSVIKSKLKANNNAEWTGPIPKTKILSKD